jgi:hypothetical protein
MRSFREGMRGLEGVEGEEVGSDIDVEQQEEWVVPVQ